MRTVDEKGNLGTNRVRECACGLSIDRIQSSPLSADRKRGPGDGGYYGYGYGNGSHARAKVTKDGDVSGNMCLLRVLIDRRSFFLFLFISVICICSSDCSSSYSKK